MNREIPPDRKHFASFFFAAITRTQGAWLWIADL